jgi:hypothetical protein
MFIVNTSTKKFTESASLDLGLLPADGKIDIQLTDGSKPVIAEGKQFAMTIGTLEPTLYKTDGDTVSFRYIQFDETNVSSTMNITMEMDGVEILNDTISLTYQGTGGGGGGSVAVDTVLSESSPNPVANATITKAINRKADSATTLAGYGITDAYTKTEIDSKVASVYHYKGTVLSYSALPSSDKTVGDVYNIESADATHGIKAGDNVAWNGTEWDVLAGEIDLSAYATKAELATKLDKPATAGTVGQILTKTADGQEWAEAPAQQQADWTQTNTTDASYVRNRNTSTIATSSGTTYVIAPGLATTPVITVFSALTLSASTSALTHIAYAEVVLDIASGATVTAGYNLTLVDTPEAGKRNICVVRWSGGVAKLYVTIVEDLPQV